MLINEDFTGRRSGKLTAVRVHCVGSHGGVVWECVCDCGAKKLAAAHKLIGRRLRSCGCGRHKVKPPVRHGHALSGKESGTYASWSNMRYRVLNPNHPQHSDYGARGIKICARWDRFENFLFDMGERPKGTSLDRIDNDGNYEPGNCRWATSEERANNTRWNVFIEWRGERRSISQWAKKLGMSINVLHYRIRRLGMNMDDAVSTPVPKRSRHRGPDKAKRKPRGQRG